MSKGFFLFFFLYLNPKVQSSPACAQETQRETILPTINVLSVILIAYIAASKFFCHFLSYFFFFIREYILYAD